MPGILEDADNTLSDAVQRIIAACHEELDALEPRIKDVDDLVNSEFRSREACKRLAQIEGFGPLA